MRVLLLNQYSADSGAPTGRILAELATGLRRAGHDVVLRTTDPHYGLKRRTAARILHELHSHFVLLLRSLSGDRADAVISLTSPACLAVTAGLIARLHGARHLHWAMDLYPDVGTKLGELPDGTIVQLFKQWMRRAYRKAHVVVALDEDMRDYLRTNYGVDSWVIPPFPPEVRWPVGPAETNTGVWLYSGNLGRAHEIDILLEVQARLEARGVQAELVLQGHGAQFAATRQAAAERHLQRVSCRPPAAPDALGESLLRASVLVVSRRPDLKGLLLPSKLLLAELSGRPLLWIGDTDGHTARLLRKAGHGVFGPDQGEAIAAWLEQAFHSPPDRWPVKPQSTERFRESAIHRWLELLDS